MNKIVKITLIISILANLAIFYVAYKAWEYRSHINHFLEKYQQVSEEFSARSTYAEANDEIVLDSTFTNRIVFFGTRMILNYDLKKYFPDYEAVNRGVEGQRVAGYLLRYKPDVLDLHPRAVVIEISSYNFRPYNTIEEIQDYTELLAQLSRFNRVEPILTTVITPRLEFKEYADIKELGDYNVFDSVGAYNRWLKNYCSEYQLPLVDIDSLLADENGFLSEKLSDNLVEPDDSGYLIISDAIKKQLALLK